MSIQKDDPKKNKEKSIHAGHRKRMLERFYREGLDNFTDIQILEMLLFFSMAQGDTNPLAHTLLDRFQNSLARVLDAPREELQQIKGIGEKTVNLIKFTQAMARAYDISKAKQTRILSTLDECGAYLLPFFKGKVNEVVYVLFLNGQSMVLDCVEMTEGCVGYAGVPIRRVVEKALLLKATSVVMAHNHPGGLAVPSMEDVQTTRRLAAALSTVDIVLADHIVVADDDYVSMVQSGYRLDDCLIY